MPVIALFREAWDKLLDQPGRMSQSGTLLIDDPDGCHKNAGMPMCLINVTPAVMPDGKRPA